MNQSRAKQQGAGRRRGSAAEAAPRTSAHPALRYLALPRRQLGGRPLAVRETLVDVLARRAAHGELQLSFDDLLRAVCAQLDVPDTRVALDVRYNLSTPQFLESRKIFEGQAVQTLYSLRLKELSVQAILWTVLSVAQSRMRPVDKLVFARLKEAFGVVVGLVEWRNLLALLAGDAKALAEANRFAPSLGTLTVDFDGENYTVGVDGLAWPFDDAAPVDEDGDDFACFVSFLRAHLDVPAPADFAYDLSSRENLLTWTSVPGDDGARVRRAVPGGNYGCATFAKLLGPPRLRELSLGTLCAFVRAALKAQLLTHFKTLIVLNVVQKASRTLLLQAQAELLRILEAHPEGVSLSHLPALLGEQRGGFSHAALGFAKFKHFVFSLEDRIDVVRKSSNHARVFLKRRAGLLTESCLSPRPLQRPPPRSTLLLQLLSGRAYERAARALLFEVVEALPGADLAALEREFAARLRVPLDLMTVCCWSVKDFILRSLGENGYLLNRARSPGPCKPQPSELGSTALPVHEEDREPSSPAASRSARHLFTARELANLNNLLNDDA